MELSANFMFETFHYSKLLTPPFLIGDIMFKNNRLPPSRAKIKFIEVDPDPKYTDSESLEKKFMEKLKTSGNEISTRCNCTDPEEIIDANVKEKLDRQIILDSR